MSRTRTTPDSAVETTKPKRISVDPKEQQINDRLDALFKDLMPPSPPPPQNPIDQLRDNNTIRVLAEKLLVISGGELVEKAKQILSGIPECEEGVEKFSNAVCEIWPLLTDGIRQVMYKVNVVGLILRYSNYDSATKRWSRTKADPSLESSLAILKPAAATTDFEIMRVFLVILIGYWGDRAELPKLDDAIGKPPGFGQMLYVHEFLKKEGMPPPEKRVDNFHIKSRMLMMRREQNTERVQEWLVSTYGDDKNVDRDALLEKMRCELSTNMKLSLVSKLYDGKSKAMVHIRLADGCCIGVSISMSFWNA